MPVGFNCVDKLGQAGFGGGVLHFCGYAGGTAAGVNELLDKRAKIDGLFCFSTWSFVEKARPEFVFHHNAE